MFFYDSYLKKQINKAIKPLEEKVKKLEENVSNTGNMVSSLYSELNEKIEKVMYRKLKYFEEELTNKSMEIQAEIDTQRREVFEQIRVLDKFVERSKGYTTRLENLEEKIEKLKV